jgi:O-antigen/teichoic acid export membrane protein
LVTLGSIVLAYGYRREAALVIVAAAISAGIDSVSDIIYGLLQQHERMGRIAQSLIIKGTVSLIAFTAVVVATRSVFYGILAVAGTRVGVLLGWDLRNAAAVLRTRVAPTGLRPRWEIRRLLAMAWLSLPLGISLMLIVLLVNIPRYFVDHFAGEHALGIFGALDYLGLVGTTAITAMGESAMPRLARCYAAGQTTAYAILLAKLAAVGAALGAVGVAIAIVAGRPILAILYGPEYAEQSNVLVWTMSAAAIGYMAALAGYGVTAARYFRIQIPLLLLVAAVTAVACWWLVPRAGLTGAALAMCVMCAAQLVSRGSVIVYAMRAPAGASPAWEASQP